MFPSCNKYWFLRIPTQISSLLAKIHSLRNKDAYRRYGVAYDKSVIAKNAVHDQDIIPHKVDVSVIVICTIDNSFYGCICRKWQASKKLLHCKWNSKKYANRKVYSQVGKVKVALIRRFHTWLTKHYSRYVDII